MIDAARMRQVLGPLELGQGELQELVDAAGRPAPVAVRVRPEVDAGEVPFPARRVGWHPRGLIIDQPARPAAHVEFAAGDYYIQDAGSLLAVSLLAAREGERICDLCAAPGGKSTAILETLGSSGWLLSNEAIQSRGAALGLNLARHGATRYALCFQDPQRLAEQLGPIFDAVLVDAPCSGQSLVGRGRQTSSAFEQRTVEHCAARQMRILDAAAGLVRPGGRLVYSTCTFAHLENEGTIRSFLQRHPAWRPLPCPALEAWQSPGAEGCYRVWPHREPSAGAFASAVCRAEDDACGGPRTARHRNALESIRLPEELSAWGTLDAASVWRAGACVFAWPEHPEMLLAVARGGPEVTFRKRVTWFPAYALAMRRDTHWQPARVVTLDDREATDYVQGLTIATRLQGWAVATWRGRSLGWVKGDGRRAKNHLPKPARLTLPTRSP